MLLEDKKRIFNKLKKQPNGCWEWQGFKSNNYGKITIKGSCFRVHRLSWELHYGEIPESMNVLHKCDNPPCANPDHLWLGTAKDNVQDMYAKGREGIRLPRRGEDHPSSKLSEKQILKIRELYIPYKISTYRLATIFKVSKSCIFRIVKKQSWKTT